MLGVFGGIGIGWISNAIKKLLLIFLGVIMVLAGEYPLILHLMLVVN